MRKFWIIFSSLFTIFNYAKAQDATGRNLYSTRYDNLNIDTILSSNRLVSNYVECLINRKPCPPEGKELKRILPEALRTKCGRCSPRQKENAIKVITKLYNKYPDQYKALTERWDPTGEYNRRFEEYLRDQQFNQINNNERPVRNDFERDQSQINVQKIPPNSPNAIMTERPRAPTASLTTTTERRAAETTEKTQVPLAQIQTQRPTRSPVIANQNNNQLSGSSFAKLTTATTTTTVRTTRLAQRPRPVVQLPTIQPQPVFANRFGGEDDDDVQTTVRQTTTQRATPRPTTRPAVTRATNRYTVANNIIDNFFIPPSSSPFSPTAGPLVGLFNQIGSKLQNTAGFFAGMIRTTVSVIVGVHQTNQNAS